MQRNSLGKILFNFITVVQQLSMRRISRIIVDCLSQLWYIGRPAYDKIFAKIGSDVRAAVGVAAGTAVSADTYTDTLGVLACGPVSM